MAFDDITKPFRREEAVARVHTHVELRQLRLRLEREAAALQGANDALRLAERQRAEAERERLIQELQTALAEIKTLSGIIPICASCKKIRDDQGFRNQVESYISSHSPAVFSHGIWPDCLKRDFPDFADDD